MTGDSTETHLAKLDEQMTAMHQQLHDALEARDKALSIALIAMDRRLEGMNEFRASLKDQSAAFMTRNDYYDAHQTLVKSIDALRDMIIPKNEVIGITERLESRMGKIERDEAVRSGRLAMGSIILSLVVVGISAVTLVMHWPAGVAH